MNTSNIFEDISRQALRFDSPQGQLPVEDLWNLPLSNPSKNRANLDDIARALNKQLKSEDEESFVAVAVKTDNTIKLKFEVIKHIITIRLAENAAASLARESREKKQFILGLIAQKENEVLVGSSLEDLKKMINSL